AAVRKASAARVSVGFAVALVGKTLEPTIQRFGTSCVLPQRSTTESLGSSPMTHVPMMCAAVFQLTRLVLGLSSSFAVGGLGMVAFITPKSSVATLKPWRKPASTYAPMSNVKRDRESLRCR